MKYLAQGSLAELRALRLEIDNQADQIDLHIKLDLGVKENLEDKKEKLRRLRILCVNEIEKRIDTLISKHVEK